MEAKPELQPPYSPTHQAIGFRYQCLHCIIKIKWPKTILTVSKKIHHFSVSIKKCGVDEQQHITKRRKWAWVGHTLRRKGIASLVLSTEILNVCDHDRTGH